jgi:type IV pilus assembly protein PilO
MALSEVRFENLPRPAQIGIVSGIAVLLAVFFYMYVLKDMIGERDGLLSENQKLEISVQQTTAFAIRLKTYKKELEQLEERLAVLQSILPAEKETPGLLRSIQQMAASSDLNINRFQPHPMVPRDFYSDWPIEIIVEGNYNGLGLFFEKMSQATRIIDVDTLSIKNIAQTNDPNRTLIAACNIMTYVFRENQPAKPQKKEKNR